MQASPPEIGVDQQNPLASLCKHDRKVHGVVVFPSAGKALDTTITRGGLSIDESIRELRMPR